MCAFTAQQIPQSKIMRLNLSSTSANICNFLSNFEKFNVINIKLFIYDIVNCNQLNLALNIKTY